MNSCKIFRKLDGCVVQNDCFFFQTFFTVFILKGLIGIFIMI